MTQTTATSDQKYQNIIRQLVRGNLLAAKREFAQEKEQLMWLSLLNWAMWKFELENLK